MKRLWVFIAICGLVAMACPLYAMHIMEGFLPMQWAGFWWLVAIPFFIAGSFSIKKIIGTNPKLKVLLGLMGAFAFVLSSLKMPSVTGSCSHPTGVGLGAILFGPLTMSVIGGIVLLFQAILLAHGGLTTLGANACSMAIGGPFLSYIIFYGARRVGVGRGVSVFLSATLGDLFTYVITSFQLSFAFPSPVGGFSASLYKFMGIYAVTQVPLAISEGILTVIVFNLLMTNSMEDLKTLPALAKEF